MKTWNRICIREYTVADQDGNSWTAHRGQEYLTSAEHDGHVTVFANYWVKVPVSIFGGEEPFTKQ